LRNDGRRPVGNQKGPPALKEILREPPGTTAGRQRVEVRRGRIRRQRRWGGAWRSRLCLLALSLLSVTGSARATDRETEFNPFNFAYATYIGSGFYSNGSRSIFVIHIPLSFRLRPDDARYFGLRLTAIPTFGFYDWTREDMLEFDFPDRLGTASVTAGLEFRVPVLSNWRLDPFIDYGVGRDSEFDQAAYIFGSGIRSRAAWPWKQRNMLLWNEWLYASNFGEQYDADDFSRFQSIFEVRVPGGFAVGGHAIDFGPFLQNELFFNRVVVKNADGEPFEIRVRNEIGVTFGTAEPSRLWRIPIPRVGVSYRFGDGNEQIRVLFTARY
jgi:hypothetical protein